MNYGSTGKLGAPGTNLVTITDAQGHHITVNKAAAQAFTGFLNELEGTGYQVSSVGGYANRPMRGGRQTSEHAYGAAIDINPAANPFHSSQTDLPKNVHDIAAKYGLVWGGDWSPGSRDPMHFQYGGPGGPITVTAGATPATPAATPATPAATASAGTSPSATPNFGVVSASPSNAPAVTGETGAVAPAIASTAVPATKPSPLANLSAEQLAQLAGGGFNPPGGLASLAGTIAGAAQSQQPLTLPQPIVPPGAAIPLSRPLA